MAADDSPPLPVPVPVVAPVWLVGVGVVPVGAAKGVDWLLLRLLLPVVGGEAFPPKPACPDGDVSELPVFIVSRCEPEGDRPLDGEGRVRLSIPPIPMPIPILRSAPIPMPMPVPSREIPSPPLPVPVDEGPMGTGNESRKSSARLDA